jgi:peptide/nickel transport system substrate-binding protein
VPTVIPTATPLPVVTGLVPKYGGIIPMTGFANPTGWDPHLGALVEDASAMSNMYNQLVEYDPIKPDQIIGDLAQSWDLEDGVTYMFHLVEGVKWQDGEALDADDVAFSINRMIEEGANRPRTGLLRASLDNAEVVDSSTVKVTLKNPSASFIRFLAVDFMKVVPRHVIDAGIDINLWDNIVGSGPFVKEEQRRGDSFTHERNPDYFKDGLPYWDAMTAIHIEDPGTSAAAFIGGRLDMAYTGTSIQIDDANKIVEDTGDKFEIFFTDQTLGLHMFANVENEPWDDLRIINALRLATDQDEMQKTFGDAFTYGAPFPTGTWYGRSVEELAALPGYGGLPGSTRTKEDDIAEAKRLLAEAGYDPPSELGKRTLLATGVTIEGDRTQLWAAQMRRNLGIEIEINMVDVPTAIGGFNSGNYDLAAWGYAYNIPDPDDWVNAIYGPGTRNYTRWQNDRFLELFDQQTKEPDRAKRAAILREMEDILVGVNGQDPYITTNWSGGHQIVGKHIRTEAGGYVAKPSGQIVNKNEHMWFAEQ